MCQKFGIAFYKHQINFWRKFYFPRYSLIKMSSLMAEYYSKCRFCLKGEEEVGKLSFINLPIIQLFHNLTSLIPRSEKEFSSVCCLHCNNNLVMFFNFKHRLITNQKKLVEEFHQKQLEQQLEKFVKFENQMIPFVPRHELPHNIRFVTKLKVGELEGQKMAEKIRKRKTNFVE